MPLSPQAYRPSSALTDVADFLADPVQAADFPQTILRFRNDRAAAEIGLETLSDDEWVAHLGRFQPLPGTLPGPFAMRYHGHQFRQYNSDLGDGRGFTFAQMTATDGRMLELGTKGSGQTPYSRFGDGRLTLKGGVREILATEMLEALNVPTSRTLSIIETGEALHRGDEPSPHPLRRDGADEPRAYPHRQFPAARLRTRRGGDEAAGRLCPEAFLRRGIG